MQFAEIVAVAARYWPVVTAGLFLAYTLASGNTAQLPAALAGVLGALGYHSATSAHEKIADL